MKHHEHGSVHVYNMVWELLTVIIGLLRMFLARVA